MTESKKRLSQNEIATIEFENFLDFVDKLSNKQKQELAQKLIGYNSPLTVILGGYNVINNSFALQLNGDSEKIAEQLQNLPPEAIQSLTEAIAMWFGQNKIPIKI
jgi:hypothetical protein